MFYITVWNETLERTQDVTCPEFLRLSEGPRFTKIKMPWVKNQKFYHIFDLDTGKDYYKPTTEARMLCGMTRNGFRIKMKSKTMRRKAIRTRFLVDRIPRLVFITKTGRLTDEQRDYFYKY